MRCPACHQNIRVQGKFCPKCGEQIFGLPVGGAPPDFGVPEEFAPPAPPAPPPRLTTDDYLPPPPVVSRGDDYVVEYPSAPAPGGVLDITLEDTSPVSEVAGQEVVGKICPLCRFPIKPGEAVRICPSCAAPHHLECWNENRGCTTYGCQSSPQMAGAQAGAGVAGGAGGYQAQAYGGHLPRQARALLEQELDRLATNALVFSLLWFLCFIPAIIGLLTGISVLGQIKQARLEAKSARTKAWIAVGISLAVLLGLAIAVVKYSVG